MDSTRAVVMVMVMVEAFKQSEKDYCDGDDCDRDGNGIDGRNGDDNRNNGHCT